MRYRPFGVTGIAVSAVSVVLSDTKGWRSSDWTALIYAALEEGVNMFEIVGQSPAIIEGVTEGLRSIERRLVFVTLRLGRTLGGGQDFTAQHLAGTADAVIARTGLQYLDAVLLDDPPLDALAPDALAELKSMRSSGTVRMIGIRGNDPALDYYISMGAFDVLSMPFNLSTGWLDRIRLKAAVDKRMAVIGYDFIPADIAAQAIEDKKPLKRGLFGLGRSRDPLAGVGTYAFLETTPGWTMEEICLASALTEPSLASIQIDVEQAERIRELAAVPERDLPSGLSSRIEMARFSVNDGTGKSQRRG